MCSGHSCAKAPATLGNEQPTARRIQRPSFVSGGGVEHLKTNAGTEIERQVSRAVGNRCVAFTFTRSTRSAKRRTDSRRDVEGRGVDTPSRVIAGIRREALPV
jgi:hypothetical protein